MGGRTGRPGHSDHPNTSPDQRPHGNHGCSLATPYGRGSPSPVRAIVER